MAAHRFVIMKEMMRCACSTVNIGSRRRELRKEGTWRFLMMKSPGSREKLERKKPDSEEPGFKYWPRWADTITFQEG
jgi:hypothetical protein